MRSSRVVVALVAGLAAVAAFGEPAPRAAGDAVVWLADREGGRVVALDAALREVASVELAVPRIVRATDDGGAWVVCGAERERLVRLGAGAAVLARERDSGRTGPSGHAPILDVAALPGGRAVALVGRDGSSDVVPPSSAEPEPAERARAGRAVELVLLDRGGRERERRAAPTARWVVASGDDVLVGGGSAGLFAFGARRSLVLLARAEAEVDAAQAIACARDAGAFHATGWWTLRALDAGTGASERAAWTRWSRDLRTERRGPRGARGIASASARSVAFPSQDGALVLAARDGREWLRIGRGVDAPLRASSIPALGVQAVAARGACVAVAYPGCVALVDRDLELRAIRGGFVGLVDVSVSAARAQDEERGREQRLPVADVPALEHVGG